MSLRSAISVVTYGSGDPIARRRFQVQRAVCDPNAPDRGATIEEIRAIIRPGFAKAGWRFEASVRQIRDDLKSLVRDGIVTPGGWRPGAPRGLARGWFPSPAVVQVQRENGARDWRPEDPW